MRERDRGSDATVCVNKTKRGCSVWGRKRERVCYCMCQKREDAICRETDGVCAPAGMRGGGGGGGGMSGKGGGAKPLGDEEQECEKRARRRSKQTTRLRNATATLQSRLSGWSCGAVTRFRDSKLCVWVPESFRPCNPLVPDVLLIPESCWFSGFPLGSPCGLVGCWWAWSCFTTNPSTPVPRKRRGVGVQGDDAHTHTHTHTHMHTHTDTPHLK